MSGTVGGQAPGCNSMWIWQQYAGPPVRASDRDLTHSHLLDICGDMLHAKQPKTGLSHPAVCGVLPGLYSCHGSELCVWLTPAASPNLECIVDAAAASFLCVWHMSQWGFWKRSCSGCSCGRTCFGIQVGFNKAPMTQYAFTEISISTGLDHPL
jgi:hypothetical protein